MKENKKIEDGFKEILQNLLTVNPYFRWTASECLAHPIFDEVRGGDAFEIPSTFKLKLDVDQDDAFNYEECASEKYETKDYLQILMKEVDLLNLQR